MGKYVLILTFAALLGVTYFTQTMSQSSTAASADQAERQEEVLARQVARSAFSDGMSDVKRNFDSISDGETRQGTYENGDYELSFATSNDGQREVTVTARGTYPADVDAGSRKATYYVSGTAKRTEAVSSIFTGITVAGEVDFDDDDDSENGEGGPGCSGDACVSGIDAGGREDRRGISLPGNEDPDEKKEEACAAFGGQVEGKGGTGDEVCDVKARTESREEWMQKEVEAFREYLFELIEQDSEVVTACVDDDDFGEGDDGSGGGQGGVNYTCDLSGNSEGNGILYVDDDFEIDGNSQWNGPVFVDGDGEITINGGGSATNFNGGILMDDDSNLRMNGGNRIQYNSEKLLDYVDDVPSIGTDQIEILDRCGGLASSEEEVPPSCQ